MKSWNLQTARFASRLLLMRTSASGVAARRSIAVLIVAIVVAVTGIAATWLLERAHKGTEVAWKYEYDEAGRPITLISPGGLSTRIKYELGANNQVRRITKVLPDHSIIVLEMDEFGRRRAMHDNAGMAKYTYDGFSQLISADREGEPGIHFAYDTLGRTTEIEVGSAFRVSYGYDFLGRVARIQTPAGLISYEYELGQGRIIRSLPNGVRTIWTYRADGKLETIAHVFANQTVFQEFRYDYRPDGLIAAISEKYGREVRTSRFSYDTSSRLVSVEDQEGTRIRYRYDTLGNRLEETIGAKSKDHTYSWNGALLTVDGVVAESAPGGTTTSYVTERGRSSFAFDGLNLVRKASLGKGSATYVYDGDGNLARRTVGKVTTSFVPDPRVNIWRPLVANRDDGDRTFIVWNGNIPVALFSGSSVEFLLTDHAESVSARVNGLGEIRERLSYGPFGAPHGDIRGEELKVGFAGLFYDPVADVYLTQARAYAPRLGRFLQRDPLQQLPTGEQKRFSSFIYCGNDPVNFVDRDGWDSTAPTVLQLSTAGFQVESGNTTWKASPSIAGSNAKSHVGGPVNIFVSGVNQRVADAQDAAARYLGPNSVGIPVDHGNIPKGLLRQAFDGAWAAANQVASGHLTTTADKLWQQLRTYPDIGTLEIYSHGAITTGNLSRQISQALDNKQVRIQNVVFTGATPNPDLVRVLDAHNVPHSTRIDGHDPIPVVTARTADMAKQIAAEHPVVGAVPFGGTLAATARKLVALGGVFNNGPYSVDAHDLTNLHVDREDNVALIAKETFERSSTQSIRPHVGPYDYDMSAAHVEARRRNESLIQKEIGAQPSSGLSTPGSGVSGSYDVAKSGGTWTGGGNTSGITGFGPYDFDNSPEHVQARQQNVDKIAQETFARSSRGSSGPSSYEVDSGDTTWKYGIGPPNGGGSAMDGGTNGPSLLGEGTGPSKVGGIYLRGAADAIRQLGSLDGVAVDSTTGRIMLISKAHGEIGLPPMRLEDIAVLFSSVYSRGESPWVTIDPLPQDPHGPMMMVRHSELTADSYVGWVLYQCDRRMKAYSLKKDNISQQAFESKLSGHRSLLELGASESGSRGLWDRFWIKPAQVNRQQSAARDMILIDVPLMVDTEAMVLRDGKLEAAAGKTPSSAASSFARWFTSNYDGIAAEEWLLPPKETGITEPVPIFAELRRIAIIAGVAEALRDEGIPAPDWINYVPLRKVPNDKNTPSMVVTQKNGNVTHRIYGGATLSPSDADVHTIVGSAKTESLAAALRPVFKTAASFSPVAVEHKGTQYTVVALPGQETRDVGAVSLTETDLGVKIAGVGSLPFTRQFHSFFEYKGLFGRSWTLDLPHLEQRRKPLRRSGSRVEFATVYSVASPLGTYAADFNEVRFVAEVGGKLLVPSEMGPMLGLVTFGAKDQEGRAAELLFRDGRKIGFDHNGNPITWTNGNAVVVRYSWGGSRLNSIDVSIGKDRRGAIALSYDSSGKVTRAESSQGAVVRYGYDSIDRLVYVDGPDGRTEYKYLDVLVTDVIRNGSLVKHYQYSIGGKVSRITEADNDLSITVRRNADRVIVTAGSTDGKKASRVVEFNSSLQPVLYKDDTGMIVSWKKDERGSQSASVTMPDANQYEISRSADGRIESLRLPEGGVYKTEYDPIKHEVSFWQGSRLVSVSRVGPDGRPSVIDYETFTVRPAYNADGSVKSVLITEPVAGGSFQRWVNVEQDDKTGRSILRDFSGMTVRTEYNPQAMSEQIVWNQGAVQTRWNSAGDHVVSQTSWGLVYERSYDATSGQLRQASWRQGNWNSSVDSERGRITHIRQADGGEWTFVYKGLNLKETLNPQGMRLVYEYDRSGRPSSVDCGGLYKLEYSFDSHGRLESVTNQPTEP